MLFTKMTKYFSREDVTCQTVASSHCTAIAVSFIPLSYSVCVFKKQTTKKQTKNHKHLCPLCITKY